MAAISSFISTAPNLNSHCARVFFHPNHSGKLRKLRCAGDNPARDSSTNKESQSENVLLKAAWYGSELLGIAASFFRSPTNAEAPTHVLGLSDDGSGPVNRAVVVETIKEDFQRSYFVTGNLTLDAYEDDCEFADPAGSFKGLSRFKRNCTNFGSLLEKSSMDLTKWQDLELLGTQNTILICNLGKYTGMWSTGMSPKWLYSSKF
ncbi:uncharacterized protein LOC131166297 isoform X4 [Malania oleifera]|uniref:uncharacterized protein LOC131166297 isoform X4 n=1 Tax=Malania oleifera TaxID=397392 RepID=UPI0025AE8DBE|nr:uncharacterized protein LOC131166297 isoform X4 [Malania oleifera]